MSSVGKLNSPSARTSHLVRFSPHSWNPPKEGLVVSLEDVERAHPHAEESRLHSVPRHWIFSSEAVKYPQQQTDGHITVIPEVTDEVTRSDRIVNMHVAISHQKVIAQCARDPTTVDSPCVFWIEDREVRLASRRFSSKQVE